MNNTNSSQNHSMFALDTPAGWIEPTDKLQRRLTRRFVLEKMRTLTSDSATRPEKERWLILFEWCEQVTLYWPDGVGVTIPGAPKYRTDRAIYSTYLIARENLESVFKDAQRAYRASLAGGAA